ncbi:hypothetical protein AYK20_00860 [Thermoplasmatales archaeon SG8-52-1]|nr:MAG: hypothetical protein AYK20_00860 [Thermoplasmatales archaeon SG8-52-1]
MPQLENDKILDCILRSIIGVISRRTSETYAAMTVISALKTLKDKHRFLQYIEIQGTQYAEFFKTVSIQPEINNIEPKNIGKAGKEFIQKITQNMGKNAGYYFLKEIKEELPHDYEVYLKEIGVDLDFLQLEFITRIRQSSAKNITNYDIIKYIFTFLFDTLDREFGKDVTYKLISELINRLNTKFQVLNYVKINDIRTIQGVDLYTISQDINDFESDKVGSAIQRFIQEINNFYGEKKVGSSLIDKLKNSIDSNFLKKLDEIGVNLDVIELKTGLVVKHVLKAVLNILKQSSDQKYAILIINNILKKFESKYEFLKFVNIDSVNLSEDGDVIVVLPDIESLRPSEIGRGLQKIIENLLSSLGDAAGQHFVEKFKKELGKAYVLRIEEMGVNLHMIELKKDLMW